MSFLEKNLAAFQAVDPATANLLAQATIPDGFQRVAGSDGTPTFVRTAVDAEGRRRLQWLGATSMPRSSAEALVASLDAGAGGGGSNGLGLSIGTGYEWAAFAARLGAAQAVFVYEPSPAELRMSLEICDLAALLSSRKLVLLTGAPEEAGATLSRFLAQHLGFEPPTLLHPLPTLGGSSPAARNQMLAAGEAIVRQAVLSRHAQSATIAQRLGQAAAKYGIFPAPADAQVIAMTLTARYPQERPIQEAIREHGYAQIPLDRYDSASLALRMQRLAELLERGPVRILSDLLRGPLGCVPVGVPVETWVPPLVGPGYWDRFPGGGAGVGGGGMEGHDTIVVHAGDHQAKLLALGVPARQIRLQPIPQYASTGKRERADEDALALRHRVALIADLPKSSAKSLEIVLPTHEAVYAAARSLVAEEFLTVHAGSAPDLLRRALARAGAGSAEKDAALGEPMLRLIRDVLIPTVPPLTLARLLADQGIAVTLIGDWPDFEAREADGDRVRMQSFGQPVRETWREVAVLAHLSPLGVVSPLIWEAVAAEIAIVAPEHPSDRQFGALASLLKPNAEFSHLPPQQFVTGIKNLLRDNAQRKKIADSTKQRPR